MAIGKFEFVVKNSADVSVQPEQFDGDQVVAHLPPEGAGVSGDAAADSAGDSRTIREIANFLFDGEERQIVEQGVAGDRDAAAGAFDVRFVGAEADDGLFDALVGNNQICALSDDEERMFGFI